MAAGVALMASGVLLAAAAITYLAVVMWRRDTARRAALVPRTLTVSLAGECLPVLRLPGAPFGDAPPPPNVPGRGTPAKDRPAAPLAAATADPPAVFTGGDVLDDTPAGGSTSPNGDTPAAGMVAGENPAQPFAHEAHETPAAGLAPGPEPSAKRAPVMGAVATGREPEPLPDTVLDGLAGGWRICAELGLPSDEQRWPHLREGQYSDATDSFAKFIEDGAP